MKNKGMVPLGHGFWRGFLRGFQLENSKEKGFLLGIEKQEEEFLLGMEERKVLSWANRSLA